MSRFFSPSRGGISAARLKVRQESLNCVLDGAAAVSDANACILVYVFVYNHLPATIISLLGFN